MNSSPPFLLRCAAPLLALLFASFVYAAPQTERQGQQTRLTFTLPQYGTPVVQRKGQSLTVQMDLPQDVTLAADQGPLSLPGVQAYAVVGRTVSLTLAPEAGNLQVTVWPAMAGGPPRLVLDIQAPDLSSPAPQVPTPPAANGLPMQAGRPRVVLDPGHGGIDPGMTSRWVREADVNLDIALRVRAELLRHGVEVVMTRETDRHLHADKATDLNARSRLATTGAVSAFVSIHVNASTNPAAQGIETYYFGQPLPGQSRSLAVRENGGGSVGETLTRQAAGNASGLLGDILAQAKVSFSRKLAQRVQTELIRDTQALNRGVQTDAFYVIRNPTTPAILIEVGFGSNPREGALLAQADYREVLAQAIARALLDFLNAP